MAAFSCPVLARCLPLYLGEAAIGLGAQLADANTCAELLSVYDQVIPAIEAVLWQSDLALATLADLHALFAEMEGHIAVAGDDRRFRFVVVIPVADRPQQLRACLHSLTGMAQAFHYGAGAWAENITVVIADDSCAPEHISENQAILSAVAEQGIATVYFGLQEQQALLAELGDAERCALHNVLGNNPHDAFCHKGASIMRNMTCLLLQQMTQPGERVLFFFADSDQAFHSCTDAGREVFTTNYFYHIDRICRQGGVALLTGKVVGDPPVSPAVMAATLLEDVLAFLRELDDLPAHADCSFHQSPVQHEAAAYHDMAGLFGFQHSGEAHRYSCPLVGAHNHADCLAGLVRRLDGFLDGEHPTRVTPYRHVDVQASVTAARTVYTGNYVLSVAALKYFIPFAGLGLRMAGPVLGRLVQADIGDSFVTANLPMLHRRTVTESGGAEFRAGVDHSKPIVDLSGEFERQFFGDVLLFTVIELVKQGYPEVMPTAATVDDCVMATETRMREYYADNQTRILARLDALDSLLATPGHWWQDGMFDGFLISMRANFAVNARPYRKISDEASRREHRQAIVEALLNYNQDRHSWEQVLYTIRNNKACRSD